MLLYEITVPDSFKDKFENFINNVNVVNSKTMVTIVNTKQIAATPKKGDNVE